MAKSNAVLVTETEVKNIVIDETKDAGVTVEIAEVVYNVDELLVTHKTKSGVIRYLGGLGMSRSQILKIMKTKYPTFLYQHVRNVLITPLKKNS